MRRALLAAGLAAALALSGTGTAAATADARENRLAGPDRFATARAVARATYPSATIALLTSGRSYADALTASYISGVSGAPLLLTEPTALPPGVTDTLRAMDVEGVLVIGGTAAVSDSVVAALEDAGFTTDRLAGNDRYETARRVAKVFTPQSIGDFDGGRAAIVTTGERYPDALTAGPMSGSQGVPILLTPAASLHPEARASLAELGIERVLIIGGTAAVSNTVAAEITAMGIRVRRVAGATRQATARQMAELGKGELEYPVDRVILTRGDDFADALAAGTRGGALAAPILYTASSTSLGSEARAFIADNAATIATVDVLGGSSVVTQPVVDEAVAAARGQ